MEYTETPRKSRAQILITVGGIAVFIIGAILGSFFVLGARSSDGKSFTIKNLASLELPHDGLDKKEIPTIENYTKEFSKTLLNTTAWSQVEENSSLSDAMLTQDIGPLIAAHVAELSALPNGFTVRTSSGVSSETYFARVRPHITFLMDIFFEFTAQDVRVLEERNVQEHFKKDAELVRQSIDRLEKIEVPPAYEGFHKEVVVLAHGLSLTLENVTTAAKDDPARALLFPASTEVLIQKFNSVLI